MNNLNLDSSVRITIKLVTIYSWAIKVRAEKFTFNTTDGSERKWDTLKSSKYIESIMLRLPQTFSLTADTTDKWHIIDGRCRLLALYEYLTDGYSLENVHPLINVVSFLSYQPNLRTGLKTRN